MDHRETPADRDAASDPHAANRRVRPAQDSRDEVRAFGLRIVSLFDQLRGDLELWARLDDTDDVAQREILDAARDVLAAIAEMVPDYLDAGSHPISAHRLDAFRRRVSLKAGLPETYDP